MAVLNENGLTRLVEHIKTYTGGGNFAPKIHANQHRAGSDTLTWDGDTTGLEFVEANGEKYFRVFDNSPSIEDLKKGIQVISIAHYVNSEYEDETLLFHYTLDQLEANGDVSNGAVFCWEAFFVPNDNTTFEEVNGNFIVTFPKKGIYLLQFGNEEVLCFTQSVTIPNCSIFGAGDDPITPEMIGAAHATHAEQHCPNDIITWDGDETGRITVDVYGDGMTKWVHVSDAVLVNTNFEKGLHILSVDSDNETYIYTYMSSDLWENDGVITCYDAAFVSNDNTVYNDGSYTITFPKKGIYFAKYGPDNAGWFVFTQYLTAPGYTFGNNTDPITPEMIGAARDYEFLKLRDQFAVHSHLASSITTGTFAGEVKAKSSSQNTSTYLLRNSRLSTSALNPTANGEICWIYE